VVLDILRDTPYWVWCLLALVLWRGFALTRPHTTSRNRLLLVPGVFVLLSFDGAVTTFGWNSAIVAAWLAGLAIAAATWVRLSLPKRLALRNKDHSYELSGSWFPLTIIVLAFSVRYAIGILLAFHADLRHAVLFGAACAFVFGGLTGAFFGRALSIVTNAQLFTGMRNANG
jgi:hypothetical protein